MLSLLSFTCFAYQVQCPDFNDPYFVRLFRDTPGAWLHLAGHLLRGGLCAWLVLHVVKYLRVLKELNSQPQPDYSRLLRVISGWWVALGWAFIVMLVYVSLSFADTAYSLSTYSRSQKLDSTFFRQPKARVAFHEADDEPRKGFVENSMSVMEPVKKTIYLNDKPIVESQDIVGAQAVLDADGNPAIQIRLTRHGGQKLKEATSALIDRKIAILIDDEVITAARVNSPISESVMISGQFTSARVQQLVDSINEAQ